MTGLTARSSQPIPKPGAIADGTVSWKAKFWTALVLARTPPVPLTAALVKTLPLVPVRKAARVFGFALGALV